MKSYSLWGVLGTSSFAALALAACTVTTNNINTNEGGTGDDSSAADGSSSSSGGSSSGGSSSGGSSSGGSSSGVTDAGDGGGTCSVGIASADGGPSACDTCMEANCCAELVACDTPGEAGVDDAGLTACENSLDCVVQLLSPDSGISQSLSDCFGGNASAAPADLTGLLNCATSHCATECQ